GDEDAIAFAVGFYRSLLSEPDDIPRAFRLGCDEVDVRQLPDLLVPRLRTSTDEIARLPVAPDDIAPVRITRTTFREETAHTARQTEGAECTIWYATQRQPTNLRDETAGYGSARSPDVHYGRCQVTIPKIHRIGTDKSSTWRRLFQGNARITIDFI